jgi:WD40 repeat protein
LTGSSLVAIWDPERGVQLHSLHHTEEVQAVTWSHDGRWLAVGGTTGRVTVWSAEVGRELSSAQVNGDWTHSLAFTQRGDLLASGGQEQFVRLSDPFTSEVHFEISREPSSLFFGTDRWLWISRWQKQSDLWEVEPSRVCRYFTCPRGRRGAGGVAFSPDGRLIASAVTDGLRLWTAEGQDLGLISGFQEVSVCFDPSGANLFVSGNDGVWRWPLRISQTEGTNVVHLGPPQRVPAKDSRANRWNTGYTAGRGTIRSRPGACRAWTWFLPPRPQKPRHS